MIITKKHVQDLLHLMTFGLIHGAGHEHNADKYFCVQQAVNKVIDGDLEGYQNDRATCVNDELNGFGVRLNDATGWNSNSERAEGLKRFAIAEMGTSEEKFDFEIFCSKLCKKLNVDEWVTGDIDIIDQYLRSVAGNGILQKKLTHVANEAANVLQEMKTKGSEFLYLVDEPDKKKQVKETCKLGNKMFASQMAEFGCSVTPKQKQ